MRRSKILAKLRANRPVRICNVGHYFPAFICHAAHHRYDCVWLDLEHRAMDDREVQSLLTFCHLYDIDCMLRPPTLEKTRLYRYFEDGAAGLMIPHVSTPEKAAVLVQSVKFPPLGDRGIDAAGIDSDFALHRPAEYVEHANRETFLVAQIETPEAVENVESIAAVEGLDGLFLGPADLNLRLQHAQVEFDFDQARDRVAAACARHGKAWGQPVFSADDMKMLHTKGARLLAYGSDFKGMMDVLTQSAKDFDALLDASG